MSCTTSACHAKLTGQRRVHSAIEETGCDGCHDGTGPHRFEMADDPPDLCLACHDDGDQQWDHADESAECLDCHDAHGSRWKNLLLSNPRTLCLDCHDVGENQPPDLVHKPVGRGDCLACHHPHRVAADPLLARSFRDTCLRCHRKVVDPRGAPPDAHAELEDGEGCVNCHEVHESEHPHLLAESYPEGLYTTDPPEDFSLCFTCHDEDALLRSSESGFLDDGGRNLHGVHVLREEKGRSCRTCHRMHESHLPHMLSPSMKMERWRYRSSFEEEPTRNTCAPACHEPRDYPRR